MRTQNVLSNEELRAYAPSVFATEPWHAMSSKYTFIPTITIVDQMRREGFAPVKAIQSRTRIAGKGDFTKHQIRFRDTRNGDAPVLSHLGQLFTEIILTNSHDGASAYSIDAGLMRLVCMNGMTVSAGNHSAMKVRHSGSADGIIEATYEVVEEFPAVLQSAEHFNQLRLTAGQQQAFAKAAIELRYDDKAPVTPEQVIRPRRREDATPSLWNTFNTAQEHLTQGGIRGYNPETRQRRKIGAVTGIAENTKLNRALWTLTQEMAKLVA
jgi:Domain of unknown function (DUF932)